MNRVYKTNLFTLCNFVIYLYKLSVTIYVYGLFFPYPFFWISSQNVQTLYEFTSIIRQITYMFTSIILDRNGMCVRICVLCVYVLHPCVGVGILPKLCHVLCHRESFFFVFLSDTWIRILGLLMG